MIEGELAAFALIFEVADVRGQQAVEGECIALFLSECGALVEARIQEQIEAGEAGADDCGVATVRRGSLFDSRNIFSLLFLYDSQIPWREC